MAGPIIELMSRDNDFAISTDHFISFFLQGAIIGQINWQLAIKCHLARMQLSMSIKAHTPPTQDRATLRY